MTPEVHAARQLPLRTYLLALVAGTALPLLLLAVVLVTWIVRDGRTTVEHRLLDSAHTQSELIDRELFSTVRTLEALAQSPALLSGDLGVFHETARRVVATQRDWEVIILLDPSGPMLLNTGRAWGAPLSSPTDPASIAQVLTTGRPAIGNLKRNAAGTLGFAVRVPVLRDGRLRYVLTAVLRPAAIAEVLRAEAAPEEWTRTITDADGTVVARTRAPEQFVGRPATPLYASTTRASASGVFRDRTLEGLPVYVAFSRTALPGWTAAIGVPVAALDAPLRQSLLAIGGVGVLLLLIAGTGGFLLARRIGTEIESVAIAAESVALGLEPAPSTSTIYEIERLRGSLDTSAHLLAARERERDEHVRSADAARAEAERANRTKDEFLAMLGHELRNPLAPVLTALQLMKLRGDTGAVRERNVIERQVRHMTRLVDDLLDVSRLARGLIELRRTRLEIAVAVSRGVEMAAPVIAERGHALTVNVPPTGLPVEGDELRLAQIFANLLTNGARYTEAGGRIVVSAHADRGEVVVDVEDTGIGLSSELLPRVFDLFTQGHRSLDRRGGGLGLGLALVRRLTELHGGRVAAASEGSGRGSRFTVRLPLATASGAEPPEPSTRADPSAAGSRILVVDDNDDARLMLEEALTVAGFRVASAADGPSAIAEARQSRPDAALIDIGLPGLDGYEVARRLRADASTAHMRLIAVTGYGQASDAAAARAAGFDVHLVKPVSLDLLLPLLSPARA